MTSSSAGTSSSSPSLTTRATCGEIFSNCLEMSERRVSWAKLRQPVTMMTMIRARPRKTSSTGGLSCFPAYKTTNERKPLKFVSDVAAITSSSDFAAFSDAAAVVTVVAIDDAVSVVAKAAVVIAAVAIAAFAIAAVAAIVAMAAAAFIAATTAAVVIAAAAVSATRATIVIAIVAGGVEIAVAAIVSAASNFFLPPLNNQ